MLFHSKHRLNILAITFSFYLSGLFYALGLNQYFSYPLIFASALSAANTFFMRSSFISSKPLFLLFLSVTLSLSVSSIYHSETELIVVALGFMSLIPIVNYLRLTITPSSFLLSLLAFFLLHCATLFISIIYSPFSLWGYFGIFRNPNTTGLFAASALMSFISLFISKLENLKNTKFLFLSQLVILLLIFIVVISSSRTSLIASFVGLLFYYLFYLSFNSYRFRNIFLILPSVIIFFVFIQSPLYQIAITDKFNYYFQHSDMLNGRDYIWRIALDNISFFGHGRLSTIADQVGESIYISILHQFGLLALLLLSICLLVSFFLPFYYYLRFRDSSLLPFFPIVFIFPFIGLTSSIFGMSPFFLWIMGISYFLNYKRPKLLL